MIAATQLQHELITVGYTILGIVGAAGMIAFTIGQFRKGDRDELRRTLETARVELDIQKGRGDRLEEVVKDLTDQAKAMEHRLSTLETENRILRETLQTGLKLAPEFKDMMLDLLRRHEEKSELMIERVSREVSDRVRQVQAETDLKVAERHRRLADHLPKEIGDALREAIDL